VTDIVGSILHKFGPVQGMVVLGGEIIEYPNGIPSAETQLEWKAEYQTHLDAVAYKDKRKKSYLPIGDQLDMQYKDLINGTTTWKDHVAKVKSDNPKG
tara:strand:+ start:214 stop:507 length:294 start_codon:yes stop_codon:yes gene_type:complete